MRAITITVPTPAAGGLLASNLLGAAGLIGLVVAVGALAGNWWWSVLVGSVLSVALAYVGMLHAQAAARPQAPAEPAGRPQLATARTA